MSQTATEGTPVTEFDAPDFTGTIYGPVTAGENGPVRHAAEYVNGEVVTRYVVTVRRRR